MHLLDIDQLRTFVAISDTGSFTRAADGQPAAELSECPVWCEAGSRATAAVCGRTRPRCSPSAWC